MEIFLPVIEEDTSGEVFLMRDGCKSHGDLNDPSEGVRTMHLPPNSISAHQPMDMGGIAATKLHDGKSLLNCRADKLFEAAALRDEAKRKGMEAGTAGLEQRLNLRMYDLGILLKHLR